MITGYPSRVLDSGELLSGRYRLEELLGRGGMGEVWRATDLRLARTVAVKACLGEPDARFTAEARVMASLHHPGIVNIYDYGDSYLVMEFVDGQPLSSLLDARGALDSATTARLLAEVANALQVVHDHGIVHRDVKPANILLDSAGNAKLTDFGVAASGNDGTSVQGTARYMAPEQAMGHPVTPAADIYALGAVGYHCLAGFPPFGGEDAVQIALHHIQDALPPLPSGTSPGLRRAVGRAMAKDPVDRFPSAAAFAAALELAPVTLVSNVDKTLPTAPVRRPRRRGALVTIMAAIALIALGGLLLAANLSDSTKGESPGQVPPAAPGSNQPSPAPLVTEQVRRSARPTPTPPRTTGARPSPARTPTSPTPPAEPTAAPTSAAPPLVPPWGRPVR